MSPATTAMPRPRELPAAGREPGWADFQVRSGQAIQRHWTLVDVALRFCWRQLPANEPPVVSDLARAGAASLSITLAKGIGISLYLPP